MAEEKRHVGEPDKAIRTTCNRAIHNMDLCHCSLFVAFDNALYGNFERQVRQVLPNNAEKINKKGGGIKKDGN